MPVINANSVDSDSMLHSAASDLGLHCQCPIYGTLGTNRLNNFQTILKTDFRSPLHPGLFI